MSEANPDEASNEFNVDFIKSNFFRVVYAEGFWCSLSAGNNLHIAFWNSRGAIPKKMKFKFDDEGELQSVDQEMRADQIREVEVSILMGVDTAKELRNYLDQMIADLTDDEDEQSLAESKPKQD